MDVAHREIVALDADAGAVVVANRDAGALDAFDQHALGPDHQGGLAFDRVAAQVGAGLAAQLKVGRVDDGPLRVHAGRQNDTVAGQSGIQRILQAAVTTVRLRGAGGTDAQRAGCVCAVGST